MISTAEFLKLTPRAQREIITDGLLYIKIHSRQFSNEMAKLNGWLASMEVVDVEPDFVDRFIRITRELEENIDTLSSRIVQNAERINEANELFQRRKLSDRLNKPQQ